MVFTSVYGLLGHDPLGAYAAANAFQDALCAQRRSEGLPALSIAWGTWAGAGMAHRLGSEFARAQEASGLGMLSLDEGFTALTALATSSLSQAAVLPMNWARYAACRSEPHPLAATMYTYRNGILTAGDARVLGRGQPHPSIGRLYKDARAALRAGCGRDFIGT